MTTKSGFLARWMLVPASPLNLALLRIVVFTTLLVQAWSIDARRYASLPDDLLRPPGGIGRLLATVADPTVVGAALAVLTLVSIAAVIGWFTRVVTPVATVLSVYVLGVPQLYGKVDHYHHLVALALILAASPCADALSVDAFRSGGGTPRAAVRYGFPQRCAWLVIGAAYLFPGLAKLGAPSWFDASSLQNLLSLQRWAVDLPPMPVPPTLLLIAAGATVVFEIAFAPLVFTRWRPWALASGLLFHLATYATMRISFWTLWICYVAFISFEGRNRRSRGAASLVERNADGLDRPSVGTLAVTVPLLLGIALYGALQETHAWPVASHPTFAAAFGKEVGVLEVRAAVGGGVWDLDVYQWVPSSRRPAMLAVAAQEPRAFAEALRSQIPDDVENVEIWHVVVRTDDRTVVGEEMLLNLPIAREVLPVN